MSKCICHAVQTHKAAVSGGAEALQRSLAEGGTREVLRIGRKQGVALTIGAEAVVLAIGVLALPEVRGKVQETCSDLQRRVRDASFRLRHKGDSVTEADA